MARLTMDFDYLEAGKEIQKDAVENNGVFYDKISIAISTKGQEWIEDFWLYIRSYAWFEQKIKTWKDSSLVQRTLIVDHFDEAIAKRCVESILKECNKLSEKEAFIRLMYHLEHETEDWVYRPRKGFANQVGKADDVGKLRLVNIMFPNTKSWGAMQYEEFNVQIQFVVNDEAVNKEYVFNANVMSTWCIKKALEKTKQGLYIKNALVLKFYDESMIKDFIISCMKTANFRGLAKAFDCLSHEAEYVDEPVLYQGVKELSL